VEITVGALRGCRGRLLDKKKGMLAISVTAFNGGARVVLPDTSWVRLPAPVNRCRVCARGVGAGTGAELARPVDRGVS